MAINLLTQYPTGADPISGDWPFGEPRNIVAPGDGLGTPWEVALVKEIVGLQQALLTAASIVPSGTPEKVTASQYMQAIIELASGRAVNYDETGIADAYVLDARTGMEGSASYFTDMEINFTPANVNTGASTVNVTGLGVQSLRDANGAVFTGGELLTTEQFKFKYNGTNFILQTVAVDTLPFQNSFTSANQVIAAAAVRTIPHGLIVSPELIQAKLVCTVAEHGYSIGDEILMPTSDYNPASSFGTNIGASIEFDATNVIVRMGSNINVFAALDGSGVAAALTNGSWVLVVKAWV